MDLDPLSVAELDDLLCHLLRVPAVFAAAQPLLQPTHFDLTSEPHLAAMWILRCDLAPTYKKSVPYLAFYRELQRRVENDPDALTNRTKQLLLSTPEDGQEGLVYWCYHRPARDLSHEYGLQLLHRFMHDRAVVRRVVNAVASPGTTDFSTLLKEATQQSQRISAVGKHPRGAAIRTSWGAPMVDKFTTGFSVYDAWMSGGQAAAEVYGLLAPYGAGKTTQICYLAVGVAQHFLAEQLLSGGQKGLKHAYLFMYEEPQDRVQVRLEACVSAIQKNRLETIANPETEMSRRGNLLPYEQAYFAKQYGPHVDYSQFPGEYERYQAAANALPNLHIFTMNGENGGGDGYVQEIANYLAMEVEEGRTPGWIGIDYVGELARRHIVATDRDPDRHLRHFVKGFAVEARNLIAVPFQLPIWALHQFTGAATGRSPGAKMHHSDAAEAKGFAENLDFCFTLSNLTKDYVGVLRCTKARRDGSLDQSRLIRIDGALQRVLDVDDEYCRGVDNSIMKRSDAAGLFGDGAGHGRRRQQGTQQYMATGQVSSPFINPQDAL